MGKPGNQSDSLGDRLKRYEQVPSLHLQRRTPVIIRVDGKAFSSLTRNMKRPWDEKFQQCMWETALYLCKNVEGCRLAYVQSDEISLLLTDYSTFETQPWFGYRVQKVCSVSASLATAAFNSTFRQLFPDKCAPGNSLPIFDSRVFNIQKEEVCNYMIWRQQDATRNSISMLAQAHFSHQQLYKKSNKVMQDMLVLEKGINWNDQPVSFKRGVCCRKEHYSVKVEETTTTIRSRWSVDTDIPIFSEDRFYVEQYV
jgi:tRNA(His) guanylyltransferase